jgi:hypothetical protein
MVNGAATSVQCTSCSEIVRPVCCEDCGHYFLRTMHGRCRNIPFSSMVESRSTEMPPLDPEVLSRNAPRLYGLNQRRVHRARWVAGVGALLVIGVTAFTVLYETRSKAPICPVANATSVITFDTHRNGQGDYEVTAGGVLHNRAGKVLHNPEVSWVVYYADLSRSEATVTPVHAIAARATAQWAGLAATNDGQVPPTRVKIVGITSGGPIAGCRS